MRFLLGSISISLLLGCASKSSKLLSPSNLPSHFITVDPARDTLILTPGGAILKFKKGTFSEKVELEIKEAYTIKDILLAGLVTESNGRPLTSGGMIYVQNRDGSSIEVLKPIDITLPSDFTNSAMKLYKGEAGEDSAINWIPSDSVQTSTGASYETGRAVFQQNCRTCHTLNTNLTGPALKGFKERGPWKDQMSYTDLFIIPQPIFPRMPTP